ncbi:MAG: hypothetical protein LV481_14185 [Methylacidiphilales bacterium]|nr:hypothetical protein [Candidatus Methylacidiphilales bacterium]
MDSKKVLKDRLSELEAAGFPDRVKDALLTEINEQATTALNEIVQEVVTPQSLATLFANGSLADVVKRRRQRKQVSQEGRAPFDQHVTGPEPGTVTGFQPSP